MVSVNIRIESYPTTDAWWRNHGKAVDQVLNNDWWSSQPEKVINPMYPPEPFTHEEILDLAPGEHTVEYAVSGYVPDYAWHAKIYVNGELKAEGDVGRYTHLKTRFMVGVPGVDWWVVAAVGGGAALILVGGIVAYMTARR